MSSDEAVYVWFLIKSLLCNNNTHIPTCFYLVQ